MIANVGSLDRAARVTVGIQMIALSLSHSITGGFGVALLVIGAVALVTGATGRCPLYRALGWSTVVKEGGVGTPATFL